MVSQSQVAPLCPNPKALVSLTKLCVTCPCLHAQCPLMPLLPPSALLSLRPATIFHPWSPAPALPHHRGWSSAAQCMTDFIPCGVPVSLSPLGDILPATVGVSVLFFALQPQSTSDAQFCGVVPLGNGWRLPCVCLSGDAPSWTWTLTPSSSFLDPAPLGK